jgi:biopolymer transport protein TolR
MHRFQSRRKRIAPVTDITLTPLIDTALTLLVIFMVAAPMMQNSIKVSLPKGNAKESVTQTQDLVVFVDSKGSIFFDNKPLIVADLITVLHSKTKNNQDQTVYVKADTAVSYGTVIELVDHLKVVGGIKYVALATQKHA